MKKINLLILLVIVATYIVAFIPQPVNAVVNWYNAAWLYRKSISINGTTAGVQTNYQLPIRVYYTSGTDGTEASGNLTLGKVYLNNKCSTNFSDLRFTKSDGITLLDYWIENYTVSNNATVWVEFDYITASPSTNTFYLYYGNTTIATTSSGTNTMLFYDDFESGALTSWTAAGAGWSNTNTVAYSGNRSALGVGATGSALLKTITLPTTFSIEMNWTQNTTTSLAVPVLLTQGGVKYLVVLNSALPARFQYYTGVYSNFPTDLTMAANTWYKLRVMVDSSSTNHSYITNRDSTIGGWVTTVLSATGATITAASLTDPTSATAGVAEWVDNYFIRKWSNPEPTFTAWGAEEYFNRGSVLVIQDVKIFQSFSETNDWLICVRYLNIYPPYYDTYDIKKLFVVQLLDTTGVVRGQSPLNAWGNRPGSLYLSAATISSLEWGQTYSVRLYGLFSGNPYVSYTLTSADWIGNDLANLDSWVITTASVIEAYYLPTVLTLTSVIAQRGEVLNSTGGSMFDLGIPGLSLNRPNIFQTYNTAGNRPVVGADTTYMTSLKNWQASWGVDGTRMLTLIGNMIGVGGGVVGAMFFLLPMLALMVWGFMPSSSHAASILTVPIFFASVYFGTDLLFVAIIALIAIFLFVKQWWFDK